MYWNKLDPLKGIHVGVGDNVVTTIVLSKEYFTSRQEVEITLCTTTGYRCSIKTVLP